MDDISSKFGIAHPCMGADFSWDLSGWVLERIRVGQGWVGLGPGRAVPRKCRMLGSDTCSQKSGHVALVLPNQENILPGESSLPPQIKLGPGQRKNSPAGKSPPRHVRSIRGELGSGWEQSSPNRDPNSRLGAPQLQPGGGSRSPAGLEASL